MCAVLPVVGGRNERNDAMSKEYRAGDRAFAKVGRNLVEVRVKAKAENGWNGGYGNMVDIDHGNGIMTRYGHAEEVVVSSGQVVRRGQIIAFMGSTGFSTGPHCHYEVRLNGEAVNPANYLW